MPPAFLAEMLEARERIEDARNANNACASRLAELQEEFASQYDALLGEVAERFAKLDDTHRAKLLIEIRALLNAAKYVRGLIRDLNAD